MQANPHPPWPPSPSRSLLARSWRFEACQALTGARRGRWIAVLAILGSILAPGASNAVREPPGVWFLNAHGTGGDYVYFSVGGSTDLPPTESREVLLGWSWNDTDTAIERYPGSVPARYRPSRHSGKQPRQWRAQGWQAGISRLGIGPGRELLLLGDDEPSTAVAMRWAEMLDSVEAAYRHSSPNLGTRDRHGLIEIGRIGRCVIKSLPVDADAQGWSTLLLAGHARPSRRGGYYYVDPYENSRAPSRTIEVQRFIRFLDGPSDCGGSDLNLSLIPTPREEEIDPPYFLVWSDLELRPLSLLDLEPTPRTPAVRTLTRSQAPAREEINLARWPSADGRNIDLCQAPFMKTLCLKDLRIREQLATSAVFNPEIAAPLRAGCREIFDRLGAVPSPHPCSDPQVWRQSVGIYRTGYTGDLVLREQPRLVSRVSASGDVQWLWPGSQTASRDLEIPLADGTRIELGLPRTAPVISEPPPRISQAPPSAAPPSGPRVDPTPPATEAGQPPAATTSAPVRPTIDPVPPPVTTADPPTPRPEPPATTTVSPTSQEPTPGPSTSLPPSGSDTTIDPAPPPSTTVDPDPSLSTDLGAGSATAPPPPVNAEPPERHRLNIGSPVDAMTRAWIWPLALVVLGMTAGVALLLRSQRNSARNRRQALSPGLAALEPTAELLLEEEDHDGQPLAGHGPFDSSTDELPLEPFSEPDCPIETPVEVGAWAVEPEPPVPQPESEEALTEPISTSDIEPEVPGLEAASTPDLAISSLEPPALADPPPWGVAAETCWTRLAEEHRMLAADPRQGIVEALDTISRLGEWISCLLPVLADVEHGREDLPTLDRLPPPARREWRQSHQAVREFADFDLVVLHRLRRELASHPQPDSGRDDEGAEAQYLAGAGLLDTTRGTLPERLRSHLLRPKTGRLQELVLALQYLIEAFTVEHLEKAERQAYLGTIRARLEAKGLSTKFHPLVNGLAAGLDLRYHPARYYKARLEDPDHRLAAGHHATFDLSQRVGYSAGTEDGVIVRLSELFLSEEASGQRYSGQAWIDEGSG